MASSGKDVGLETTDVGLQTTVVGNYPKIGPGTKSPSLRAAISRYQLGRIGEEELHSIEAEVTKEVLEEQARAGVDLVTDGQVRWDDGQTYFASKVRGFELNGLIRYFDTNTYYRQPVARTRLEWREPMSVFHYRFGRRAQREAGQGGGHRTLHVGQALPPSLLLPSWGRPSRTWLAS